MGKRTAGSVFDLVLHTESGAFDDKIFGVKEQSIQHGGGNSGVIVKDRRPLFERFTIESSPTNAGLCSKQTSRNATLPKLSPLRDIWNGLSMLLFSRLTINRPLTNR